MRKEVISSDIVPRNTGPVKPRSPFEEKEGKLIQVYTLLPDLARLLGEAKSLPKGKALKLTYISPNLPYAAYYARKSKILIYGNGKFTYLYYRPDLKELNDGNPAA